MEPFFLAMKLNFIYFFLSIKILLIIPTFGQKRKSIDSNNVYKLSLMELVDVKVSTGSLSSSSYKTSISPITIISKEQIQISQARNIATLLEIYVPGMMLMAHQEGEKIGIRGQIAAENYKLLLLLNGKNITNNVYEGAFLELDQWDMNDIEKIEVMRGPGSVTYGSGAVAGVINIITKKAISNPEKGAIGTEYSPMFRSVGGHVQYSKKIDRWGIYSYASIRRSLGQQSPDYYLPGFNSSTDIRLIGKQSPDQLGPQPYLADVLDRPQVKAHIDVNYGKKFNLWARYTQSGQTHLLGQKQFKLDADSNQIIMNNPAGLSIRSIAFSPEFQHSFSGKFKLKTDFTFHNQEYVRYRFTSAAEPFTDYRNIKDYAFSQERIVGNVLLDFEDYKWKAIGGYQFSNTVVRSPWGKDENHLLVYEGINIINDSSSNVYYNDANSQFKSHKESIEVGKGIFVNTHSFLLEASYKLSKYFQLQHAARLDFPSISTMMYSPRVSLLSEISDKHTVKIIAQRSLRMMPLRAQYIYYQNKTNDTTENKFEHESLNSIELGYLYTPSKQVLFDVHTFYNSINAVGFTGNDLQFLGDMKLLGVELDAKFRWRNHTLIFNHTWLHLMSMKMNEDLKTGGNRNNISFSDYYYNTQGGDVSLLLTGYGNSLNNISENSSRVIYTQKLMNEKLILHANARLFWDYAGSYDELRMYEEAYERFDVSQLTSDEQIQFEEQKSDFEREKKLLEDTKAYQANFKLNFSLSYRWPTSPKTELLTIFYVDNFLGSRKKYYVSTGSTRAFPDRLRYILEPRTIGCRLLMNFK